MLKKIAKRGAAVVAGMGSLVGAAFAEVPAGVSTALADAKEDAVTVAGLAIVIVVAVAAFKYMRGAVR
jgi:hypothetical protein